VARDTPDSGRVGYDRARRRYASVLTWLLALIARPDDAAAVSQVEATARGWLYNTSRTNGDTGDGSQTVVAETEYAGPDVVEGRFSATASAGVGLLGATGFIAVVLGPGGFGPIYEGRGQARFRDAWVFGGRPTDTLGRLRLTLNFQGAATASGNFDTYASAFGRFDMAITSLDEFDTPIGANGMGVYNSGPQTNINHDEVIEIDFLYGRPIDVQAELFVLATLGPETQGLPFAGEAEGVFAPSSVRFTELEVQDTEGQWTTDYELTTESGGPYPFDAPEPSSTALALASIAALAARRHRPRISSSPICTAFSAAPFAS
jgi:hypothetical protein